MKEYLERESPFLTPFWGAADPNKALKTDRQQDVQSYFSSY